MSVVFRVSLEMCIRDRLYSAEIVPFIFSTNAFEIDNPSPVEFLALLTAVSYTHLHEDYGHYSYTEHYSLGDIFIYTSADEEKGVLLELKGRGCRQFESYLLAQQRSWYDFLMDALVDGGVMKRCLLYTSGKPSLSQSVSSKFIRLLPIRTVTKSLKLEKR